MTPVRNTFYTRIGKRLLDSVIALAALLVLAPVMIAVAVLVHFRLGGQVFFRQERPGRFLKPFVLLKFRTMTDQRDGNGKLLPDSQRLTPLGRLLRTASLDELPGLWNVLRGDMSLVGPRPLLTRYVPYFTETERCRFAVRPGITGLAQVSGRNQLCWDTRIAKDLEYVHNCSVMLDLRIMFLTLSQVIRHDGLEADPSAVMADFDEERRNRQTAACSSPHFR